MSDVDEQHIGDARLDRQAVLQAVDSSPFACSALDDQRRFLAISNSGLLSYPL